MPASLRQKQWKPFQSVHQSRPATEAGPEAGGAHAQLLEPLLDLAPVLVRRRSLLPAYDWREATPSQVERLLSRLAEAGISVPAWLATALLVAGHKLPVDALRNGSAELAILASLNARESSGLPEGLFRQIIDIARFGQIEPGIASAIVARLVALGEPALACRVASAQFHISPGAMHPVREHFGAEIAALPALRLRLAATSTTQALAAALVPAFAGMGLRAEITEAGFASVMPELLNPGDTADALVLLLDRTLVCESDPRISTGVNRSLAEERIDALVGAIQSWCRQRSQPLLINTLPASAVPSAGHLDRHHATGEACLVAEVNRRLACIASTEASILLVDADIALARLTAAERSDPKLWFYGRQAYSDAAMRAFAHAFSQVWQAKAHGAAKVLALDFDNTLWGGIFGDDGLDQLACGDEFPGNAYKAFQQECLRLKSQGMLLVGLSKNNPDAIDVFNRHPGMALKAHDFVATAVNWEPKPENIRRLAVELGLGLDSFVFLDDSPHEREVMRRMCPSVSVPELPSDPARRPSWLRGLSCTWPLRLTEEDARRSEMYVAERKGRELKEATSDYGQYLSALDQRLTVHPVTPDTLGRAAQLHQRTNQFNLTARRLNETEVASFMTNDDRALALLGHVRDRFGDHGIVLATCVSIIEATARIETFVMSCRVIGRCIETAFLSALAAQLAARGVGRIVGLYRPTARNGIARELYPTLGFGAAGQDDGAELWELDIRESASGANRTSPVTVEWGTT